MRGSLGVSTSHPKRHLGLFIRFYPRDAMLARVLAMACVCLSVCLSVSVTSRCSNEAVEGIGLFFGLGASFHISYTLCYQMGTSLWNFALDAGLRKFRHSTSIVEACYQLSSRKVDAQSVINWTVVGQLS